MQPVRRTQAFTNGEAQFGGPPGGFVWSVQLNVPTAQNKDTFQLYINGEQLTSTTGTGLMGPVQVFNGETITIKSSTVAAGTKAFLYGQLDKVGQQPSGIFPAISGGVVTTSSGYPLATPQGGALTAPLAVPATTWTTIFTTPSLAVGTWLITFGATFSAACYGALQVALGSAAGTLSGNWVGPILDSSAGFNDGGGGSVACLVTITTAGTLLLEAYVSAAVNAVAENPTIDGTVTVGATGWTATRVA